MLHFMVNVLRVVHASDAPMAETHAGVRADWVVSQNNSVEWSDCQRNK